MVLDRDGAVVGASWHAYLVRGSEKGKGKENGGRGDFDILTTKPAPNAVFDKPIKGKGGAASAGAGAVMPEGEEEVVEKTFLQK